MPDPDELARLRAENDRDAAYKKLDQTIDALHTVVGQRDAALARVAELKDQLKRAARATATIITGIRPTPFRIEDEP